MSRTALKLTEEKLKAYEPTAKPRRQNPDKEIIESKDVLGDLLCLAFIDN